MEITTKVRETKVKLTPYLSFTNMTPELLDSDFAKACMAINEDKAHQDAISSIVLESGQVAKMSAHVITTLDNLAQESYDTFHELGPIAIGTNLMAFVALGWYLRDQFENKEMVN